MKTTTLFFIGITFCSCSGNITEETDAGGYFARASKEFKERNFADAKLLYTKAIEANPKYAEAYYYRGTCEMQLEEFKESARDYCTAVEINPEYSYGYYGRALFNLLGFRHDTALSDLNRAVRLDSNNSQALALRAQIWKYYEDRNKACEDYYRAAKLGDKTSKEQMGDFCKGLPMPGGYYKVNLPDNGKWTKTEDIIKGNSRTVFFTPANEPFNKWTEWVEIYISDISGGSPYINLKNYMNNCFSESKEYMSNSTLTQIEYNKDTVCPYITFVLESHEEVPAAMSKSQLIYALKGNNTVYICHYGTRKATISDELREKWKNVFKTGRLYMTVSK